MRPLLVLGLLLLCACGTERAGGPAAPAPSSPAAVSSADPLAAGGDVARADNDLVVELDRGDGSPVQRWTLTCVGVVEGDHPDAEAACAHLEQLDDPFAPLPADALCAQVYGGPQTARVTGLWRGEPVDLALSRTDGCRIAQWDRLGPLLPSA